MPFNVWFYVSTFLSPWARDVGQDSCWCHTCSTGHIYLEIGIYQLFIQFECLVHLWGYGHLALGVIVWEQSASSKIETRKLHGNVHFVFDSRNHLTCIVQSLHVFFPSMVCVIPKSRPCGYYALWMIKLLTAAKASLSRMYVYFLFCWTPTRVLVQIVKWSLKFEQMLTILWARSSCILFVSPRLSFLGHSLLGQMYGVSGHICWCPPTLSVYLYMFFWYMFWTCRTWWLLLCMQL